MRTLLGVGVLSLWRGANFSISTHPLRDLGGSDRSGCARRGVSSHSLNPVRSAEFGRVDLFPCGAGLIVILGREPMRTMGPARIVRAVGRRKAKNFEVQNLHRSFGKRSCCGCLPLYPFARDLVQGVSTDPRRQLRDLSMAILLRRKDPLKRYCGFCAQIPPRDPTKQSCPEIAQKSKHILRWCFIGILPSSLAQDLPRFPCEMS